MISIFRKIRQKLLTENKVSKYLMYAVGEIVLVVIGILIALSINNWNEWRKDRVLEKEMLSGLILNLESNVSLLDGRVKYFERGQNSGKIILNVIDHRLPNQDSLGGHFSQAMRGYGGADAISYIAYEDLKNNGFGLITNKALKDEILRLFETTYRTLISFDATFVQHNAYHKEVIGKLFYHDKPNSLKPFDFDEIFKSYGFYSSLTDLHFNYGWMKEETINGLSETRRVLQLITEEKNKSD